MKKTCFTMILAAQLFGVAAFAQTTTDAATGDTNMSASFGSDWSTSLGSAVFSDDGTTVRSASEIEAMWATLSDTDKDMLRRDCMMHMQTTGADTGAATTTDTSGAATDSTGTATDSGTSAGTSTDTTTSAGTDSTTGTTTMNVTAENMEQICAAIKDL